MNIDSFGIESHAKRNHSILTMRELIIGALIAAYVTSFFYYTYPHLASIREKGSQMALGVSL